MEYGLVGPGEFLLFLLIVILVVGPLRIWRGVRAARSWLTDFFQQIKTSKMVKQGSGVLRGLGKMIEYYRRKNKSVD